MIGLDQAIKTRWDARSLGTLISSGIHRNRLPEEFAGTYPYCIFTNVSNVEMLVTKSTRYCNAQEQFQVYAESDMLAAQYCDAIKSAFLSADRAATNPLAITAAQATIVNCRLVSDYVLDFEPDGIWTGTMTIGIQYAEDSGLTPG